VLSPSKSTPVMTMHLMFQKDPAPRSEAGVNAQWVASHAAALTAVSARCPIRNVY
jgi:hypothetical protein